jgi:hypothetical protein
MRIVLAACGHTPVDAVEAGCVWTIATCCWTLRALPPAVHGQETLDMACARGMWWCLCYCDRPSMEAPPTSCHERVRNLSKLGFFVGGCAGGAWRWEPPLHTTLARRHGSVD